MSYIGRGVDAISNVEKLDNITFDGSTTYNLTKSSVAFTPSGANNILISIDGVVQQGNFTVAGSTIIFDWSPASSNTCNWIQHYGVGVLNTPADDTVKTATVQDDAITTDKLANSINTAITANTAKTTNATHSGEVTGATALTIADNIVDEANLKISNSATNGHFLSAQSGNSGGLTWAEAGGGAWELLQSVNASNTATVDFTYDFPTTYNNYFIYFNDLELASNGYLAVRAQVGGASSVRTGSTDYGSARYGRQANGNGGNIDLGTGDADANMMNITYLNLADSNWDIQGGLWIMNPNDDHYKIFQFNAVHGMAGNNIANIQGSSVMYQTGNLSRVQFMNENGVNMTGTFRLYGVKNA